jgi:hypothetical protein
VRIAVSLLVAICGTCLPNNVLHVPQYNAGFIGNPQVSTGNTDSIRRCWLYIIFVDVSENLDTSIFIAKSLSNVLDHKNRP